MQGNATDARSVRRWLAALGLERYAEEFEAQRIDIDLLGSLDHATLKELGVGIVGDRLRILTAAAELGASASTEPEVVRDAARWRPERRHLTVMFCDLVGSTSLATVLDPEDFHRIMTSYSRVARRAVLRFEGHIAPIQGDGVVAFFGWPQSYDDNAERAVWAAMQVIEAVEKLPSPEPLSVRVGIYTGTVVVGDPSQLETAFGEAPNVASRLQARAQPNTILVGDTTRRLLSAAFDCRDMGSLRIKGLRDPLHVYRVDRARRVSARFGWSAESNKGQLVGRRGELALLHERWRQVRAGNGQAVFVSAGAGVGKTRLLNAFLSEANAPTDTVMQLRCLPYYRNSALFPVIELVRQSARLRRTDDTPAQLDKLQAYIARTAGDVDRLRPLYAHLLGLDAGDAPGEAAPARAALLAGLIDHLEKYAARRPLVIAVEDAQWVDPSTLELLETLVANIWSVAVLLVVTHRPDFTHRWPMSESCAAVALPRLGNAELRQLIAQVAGNKGLSELAAERVVRKSDGVALFAEQLTIDAVNRESAVHAGTHVPRVDDDDQLPSVPPTLVDGLMARLDGIPGGKKVACAAAVLNSEFSASFLAALLDVDSETLRETLSRLEQAEVLTRFRRGHTDRFDFKHALIRDVAYDSLLKVDRQAQHLLVAELLERFYPELETNQPELLAHHHLAGRNAARATELWLAAGRQALSRSANVESIAHFRAALELIVEREPGEPGEPRAEAELQTQLDLGLSLVAVDGYPASSTRDCFASALRLSEQLAKRGPRSRALFGLWGHHWMAGRDNMAIGWARRIAKQAEDDADRAVEVIAHRALGCSHFTRGEFDRARTHLEKTVQLARSLGGDGLAYKYVVEPEFVATLMEAWTDWFLGHVDRAVQRAGEALAMATRADHAYSIAFSSYVCSAIHLQRSEYDDALGHAERSLEISRDHRFSLYELYARFSRGCALVCSGDALGGFDEIDSGIESAEAAGVGYMRPMMLGWKADLQDRLGAHDVARATLDAAFTFVRRPCGQSWLPELLRLRARFARHVDATAPRVIAGDLEDAITLARQQGALSWELRATTQLAEYDASEATTRALQEVLAKLEEGADTYDVRRARDVLAHRSG